MITHLLAKWNVCRCRMRILLLTCYHNGVCYIHQIPDYIAHPMAEAGVEVWSRFGSYRLSDMIDNVGDSPMYFSFTPIVCQLKAAE